jgi:hypothetical protein
VSVPPPRRARLVLVTASGVTLGALPALPVATPWWQDVGPVVEAVRARHGVEVTVLRLLSVAEPDPAGVEITYLAETGQSLACEPWEGALDEHPLRLSYARAGGPAADLAWALGVLGRHGMEQIAVAEQVRTWNLSSLWRIPVRGQTLWLKVVPPFFAHEGAVLEALAGGPVPTLLGHDGPRMLMAEIPGEDLYGAAGAALPPIIDLLVGLQSAWIGRSDELLRRGLPDMRTAALIPAIRSVIDRNASALPRPDQAILASFSEQLPGRLARVAECGLPDTLVHGDAHPGNLRGEGGRLTMLDWGDCGVGHPLLDQPGFLDRIAADDVAPSRRHWHEAWKLAAPGSDPERASCLLTPVAVARQAAVFQAFLDRIEPSEHPYHRADPAERLSRVAALIRASCRGRTGRR